MNDSAGPGDERSSTGRSDANDSDANDSDSTSSGDNRNDRNDRIRNDRNDDERNDNDRNDRGDRNHRGDRNDNERGERRERDERDSKPTSTMHLASQPELGLARGDDTPHALVVRLANADAAAISLVYHQHHIVIRAFAQRLVGDVEAAEDLVQDVFVALPKAVKRFRGDCALRTFLVSIAVNHAKNHVRAAARRRAALARLAREPSASASSSAFGFGGSSHGGGGGGDPHSDLERRELASDLMIALDALPLEQRVAIVLSEIEERTSAEISAIVDAPEGTVRTRIFHAKKKLREILSKRSPKNPKKGGEP